MPWKIAVERSDDCPATPFFARAMTNREGLSNLLRKWMNNSTMPVPCGCWTIIHQRPPRPLLIAWNPEFAAAFSAISFSNPVDQAPARILLPTSRIHANISTIAFLRFFADGRKLQLAHCFTIPMQTRHSFPRRQVSCAQSDNFPTLPWERKLPTTPEDIIAK